MPIEQIEGLPDAVVGLEAVGEVTSDDYERVANPAIERARAAHEKIRLVHVLDERLQGHTAGALWEDAKLGVTNLRSLERIAVVTDLERDPHAREGSGLVAPRGDEALLERRARGGDRLGLRGPRA